MAANWYYESNGTERGPISGSDIRKLAAAGEITPSTRVRPADRNDWMTAGQLRGLFRVTATPSKESSRATTGQDGGAWYLRDITGKTFGPVTKAQLEEWYQNHQISAACQIRRKDWSEWQGAAEVYPSLNERTFDWKQVRKRIAKIWPFVRDHVQTYFAGLTIHWSPAASHLRRCVANSHHQFSTHTACIQCGQQTIGPHVNQVANGDDGQLQDVYEIWANGKRRVSRLFTWSLVVCVVLSLVLFFTTWWSLVLVPFTLAIGFAIPFFAARYLNTRIQRSIDGGSDKVRQPVAVQQIDEVNTEYVDPFLRRNEVPVGTIPPQDAFVLRRLKSLDQATDVLIDQRELHMLEQILTNKRMTLWNNPASAQLVLNAFAIKNDYSLFQQRIEQLESAGMSVLAAYASLVNNDEAFLPFLQQLLTERQMPESASSLLATLETVRHELKLRGFAKDLEQRRHGSMSITMEMVDAMDPYNFELLLGMIYETQGFRVIETPKSGDQGADVLIEKAGERTVIQAKLYSDSVGNKAVQEVIAARSHFRCHAAKVVTNNYFTPSAQQLAESSDVQLIGRKELSQMIEEFNRNAKDYSRLAALMEANTSTTSAASGGA